MSPREQVPAGPPADAGFAFPASFGQQRFWMLDRIEGGGAAYTIPIALDLSGPLVPAALELALNDVVARHEALRTIFALESDGLVQLVLPTLHVPLRLVDLSPDADYTAAVGEIASAESNRPFDLGTAPLLRPVLVRSGSERHALVLTLHHIIADGWSVGILLDELGWCYEARARGGVAAMPAVVLQYADYAVWQREALATDALRGQLDYWRRQLRGPLPALSIPTDRPRPSAVSHHGARIACDIPAELAQRLAGLARSADATPFMVLLAAFDVLLYRLSGQDDVVVGTPVAGRSRAELETVVGLFINTLALRTDLSGDPTFLQVLERARRACLGAYANADVPFEQLVESLQPERDPGRTPIFQAAFLYAQGQPEHRLRLPGVRVSPVEFVKQAAKFDLTLSVTERDGALRASLEYRTDLFERETAERLLKQYRTLLGGIADGPQGCVSRLPLLSPTERTRLLDEWNRTDAARDPALTLPRLFEARVRETPDAIGACSDDASWSYRDLNVRANRIAHRLRRAGIGRDALVGVCVARGGDMIAALLGIAKAGAAYVPLDPDFPAVRLAHMSRSAGLSAVVHDAEGRDALDRAGVATGTVVDLGDPALDRECGDDLNLSPAAGDFAYVIYTSGSTGEPKGVEVSHAALANLLLAMVERPGIVSTDVLLAVTTLSFDIAALELFGPLVAGARVIVASRAEARDASRLSELLRRSGVTIMQATPTTWRMLVATGWGGDQALRIWCGGEALPQDLAAALLPRCGALWNMYGPTETTIWSTIHAIAAPADAASIGGPIANTRLYILSPAGEPVPIGVAGELWIGGAGVAIGYRGRPDLTADRFLPDPFAKARDARMYRTGDVCRWRADGSVEFFGRADQQVKVRGFRIELGEVEHALAEHPGVRHAAVAARPDATGETSLVAYLVPHDGSPLLPAELAAAMRDRLPAYMVPRAYVLLAALPLTPNGKLDRAALPEPGTAARPHREHVAPRTPVEVAVSVIWSEVLKQETIGAEDDFFQLGGHSLLVMQVMARVEATFGVALPWRILFDRPALADLAHEIDRALGEGGNAEIGDLLAELEGMSDEEARGLLRAPGAAT